MKTAEEMSRHRRASRVVDADCCVTDTYLPAIILYQILDASYLRSSSFISPFAKELAALRPRRSHAGAQRIRGLEG